MKQIPNVFTLLNLFFGCLAIVFTLQNGIDIYVSPEGEQFLFIPEKIWLASLFIGLAGVVDFLDGFVARLFKATSDMGKQLDSLADVVSFGVAPGMILYQFLRMSFAEQPDAMDTHIAWMMPAFILPCAAAWRLAKFNLDTGQAFSFKGIPTPAAGLLVASLPVIYWNTELQWAKDLLFNRWFLLAFILLLSFLMVSNIRILSLKFKDRTIKTNLPKYILLGIAIVSTIFLKWLAAPVIFIAYVLVSLLFKNKIA